MAQQTQILRVLELGVSQVNMNSRDLGLAVAAMAQESARARVAAAPPVALTDSSGGVGASGLAAVANPVVVAKDGVAVITAKTEFDTAMGLIEDAHQELLDKTNELIVLTAGDTARAVEATAGAASNDIIAAIAALTGGTTNLVDAASGTVEIITARGNQAAISAGVNYCRVAMGLDTLPDGSGGLFETSSTLYDSVDAVATAAAITANGENSLELASTNAALTALKANIATLAASLNQMRGALAIGPFVVATNNPRTRFVLADATV